MSIFDNHKTIISVYDNGREAERAVDLLFRQGFGGEDSDDHVEFLDRQRFTAAAQERAEAVMIPPPVGANNPIGLVPMVDDAATGLPDVEQAVRRELLDRGIDEKQADYFARQVAKGSVLVVVETTENRAAQAADIVRQAGIPKVNAEV